MGDSVGIESLIEYSIKLGNRTHHQLRLKFALRCFVLPSEFGNWQASQSHLSFMHLTAFQNQILLKCSEIWQLTDQSRRHAFKFIVNQTQHTLKSLTVFSITVPFIANQFNIIGETLQWLSACSFQSCISGFLVCAMNNQLSPIAILPAHAA